MNKLDLVVLRPVHKDDLNFILSTWLRGLWFGSQMYRDIRKNVFFKETEKIAKMILSREDTKVIVACLKDDPEVVLGYAVVRPNLVDWIFVKHAWRGLGIATALLENHTYTQATHSTIVGNYFIRKLNLTFNPFV